MRNNPRRLLVMVFLCLLTGPGVAGAESRDERSLIIAYDSFAQYIYTEYGRAAGLYVDVLTEAIEKRLGVPVEFVWEPWQRAQYSVEEGMADAMVTVVTPERLSYSKPADVPVIRSVVGAFTRTGHPRFKQMTNIDSIEDLQGFSVLTYLGDGWAEKALSDVEVDFDGRDIEAIFKKLEWGRGDLFPQTVAVTQHYIDSLNYEDAIVQVPGVNLGHLEFKLMIGKKSPYLDLLPEINKTLDDMNSDGSLARIKQSYGYDQKGGSDHR